MRMSISEGLSGTLTHIKTKYLVLLFGKTTKYDFLGRGESKKCKGLKFILVHERKS